jgi:hypothetical protein
MNKKHKVVTLPTDKKISKGLQIDSLAYSKFYDKFAIMDEPRMLSYGDWNGYHLYIVSDDDIKEGDWIIVLRSNRIFNVPEGFIYDKENVKKIIATTDNSLNSPTIMYPTVFFIPQLFIDTYISEYNKGNIITDVEIEYEECIDIFKEHILTGSDTEKECKKYPYLRIKVGSNNTVTIHVPKTTWTRDEVIDLCNRAFYRNSPKAPLPFSYVDKDFYQWVEDNL